MAIAVAVGPLAVALVVQHQALDVRHQWALSAHQQLEEAVSTRDLGRVRAWLRLTPDEPRLEWSNPVLIAAAEQGDDAIVIELLAAGLDPNARSKYGATPLSAARERGHASTAVLLISAGAR